MSIKIALTGDIMLGRLVDCYVIQDHHTSPESLWGDVLPLLLGADLRLANLECVIATRGEKCRPSTKSFHFRAAPRAISFLKAANLDCVTLANNHILDYGGEAFEECLALLDQADIAHAGAGRNLDEALQPAILKVPAESGEVMQVVRVAVLALTDNEPEWEATPERPGLNYIRYNARGLAEPYRSRVERMVAQARNRADLVILSAHVGPNWGKPSRAIRALAHQLIDLGVDLYWGHSNHTPQGIELYRARPIFYSTGDFVDDYAIDPDERNDLSFLFTIEVGWQGGEHGLHISAIRLYPTAIEHFHVRRTRGRETDFLQEKMKCLSAEFGTDLQPDGDSLSFSC